ncbi:MAG: patatin-like phospholipase family protein [Defluviitaleaceae bacterium]|nr:patatin-like phospholipase family protein [Defluviitaleaceae bacterium]
MTRLSTTRIGLALSGGGIRAAIYHLGVLQYMAETGLFSKIASISSVSGASMCMGLIFAVSGNTWPTTEEFLAIQPQVKKLILEKNIQTAALLRLPFTPTKWRHRVEIIAKMLENKWGIRGNLQDLPPTPFWEINCTTFETGNRFRFRRDYMGDQEIGYVQQPHLPTSHMIAASSAFPVLIGPYVLQTEGLRFTKDKKGRIPQSEDAKISSQYTLWDGGVYDNLGLDALHKVGGGLDEEIDFIIVSNASATIGHQERGRPSQNLRRLLDIATDQIDSLRTRDFFSTIIFRHKGLYLKIGYTPEDIADTFSVLKSKARDLAKACFTLTKEERERVKHYPTTLNAPSEKDFELIFRNGYESAKYAHKFYSES